MDSVKVQKKHQQFFWMRLGDENTNYRIEKYVSALCAVMILRMVDTWMKIIKNCDLLRMSGTFTSDPSSWRRSWCESSFLSSLANCMFNHIKSCEVYLSLIAFGTTTDGGFMHRHLRRRSERSLLCF